MKDEIEKSFFIVNLIEEFCELEEEDSNLPSIKENIIKFHGVYF